jgi:hypothetical protein
MGLSMSRKGPTSVAVSGKACEAWCYTKGSTSPFAHAMEMHLLMWRVKCTIPFSKVMGNLHNIYNNSNKKKMSRASGVGPHKVRSMAHLPESCWMIATLGHLVSSQAASRKQSCCKGLPSPPISRMIRPSAIISNDRQA